MASNLVGVIAGVDTHADTHHAALVTSTGRQLADCEFPATPDGYLALLDFITSHGPLQRVGIEGTSSYGAGLARVLIAADIEVSEVIRPVRAVRRRGKTDAIDAYAAAALVLSAQHLPIPKQAGGDVDAIRAVLSVRTSAVKAATAAMNQIHSLLITAPNQLRETYRALTGNSLIAALAATGPHSATTSTAATHLALHRLAHRYQHLNAEITAADNELDTLTRRANPTLRSLQGLGPITAAQLLVTAGDNPHRLTNQAAFAALCGTSPIPASSGKTNRYRLNRGGDRQANNALHCIATTRLRHDPRTKAWAAQRNIHPGNRKHLLRCLKRALCREIYRCLTNPQPLPATDDLRPLRHAYQVTLTHAAQHLGHPASTLSRIERGIIRNDTLANQYRNWLNTHPTAA